MAKLISRVVSLQGALQQAVMKPAIFCLYYVLKFIDTSRVCMLGVTAPQYKFMFL